jgi:hypothetical protein
MIVNFRMIADRRFRLDAATAFGRRPCREIEHAARASPPFSGPIVRRILDHMPVQIGRPVRPPHGTALAELSLGDVDRVVCCGFGGKVLRALGRPDGAARGQDRISDERSGLASRQSLPRTTKYRPSGVAGCLRPAIR